MCQSASDRAGEPAGAAPRLRASVGAPAGRCAGAPRIGEVSDMSRHGSYSSSLTAWLTPTSARPCPTTTPAARSAGRSVVTA
eukprot:11178208-Lingulodinium_polyedra.AAC.1